MEGREERIRIWDLPTRLFHWALVTLIVLAVISVKVGGVGIEWHMLCGYAILVLVVFRVLWGFAGSFYARFSSFVRHPREVVRYLKGELDHLAGHSPLAALAVLALLGFLLLQGGLGLFANDGNFSEGPLAKFVSHSTGEALSTIHRFGEWALYALIGLHLAAVGYYEKVRRVPLVRPMITGDRTGIVAPPAQDDLAVHLRALALLLIACAAVVFIVTRQ